MPTYSYSCDLCSCNFEKFYSFNDYVESPKCESCNSKKTVRRYIADVATISSSVKKHSSELKTIGDLAKRNTDEMSSDQKQYLYQKHNDYKEKPSVKELPSGMSRIKKPAKPKWPT